MTQKLFDPDPDLDLVLEREIEVSPELVWTCWTTPEHIKQFFTPRPWKTVHCEIDLRPGGRFHTVMESPEGKQFPNTGCYLEIVENERLVWTSALEPGFRPTRSDTAPFLFSAALLLERTAGGCRYTAYAIHKDAPGRKAHEEMGFHEGWGTVVTQLVEYAKTL